MKSQDIPQLGDLPNPPKHFFIGKPTRAFLNNCVAIVGSRQITEYGKRVGNDSSIIRINHCENVY